MNAPQPQSPRVLDVGNCGHDHGQISHMLRRDFGALCVAVDTAEQTLERLSSERFDLVLINRKLDHDYSDGIEIVKRIKQTPELADLPVMLVTNYPEHQEEAVAAGALPGFGKQQLQSPVTRQRLADVFQRSQSRAAADSPRPAGDATASMPTSPAASTRHAAQ
ncbi:MAG: response regulator [Aureliella sp.]